MVASEGLGGVRGQGIHLEPNTAAVVGEGRPEPQQMAPGPSRVHLGLHGLSEDLALDQHLVVGPEDRQLDVVGRDLRGGSGDETASGR